MGPPEVAEQLTDCETRVMRYLPTHLHEMHEISQGDAACR